jgi:hypothetical protein
MTVLIPVVILGASLAEIRVVNNGRQRLFEKAALSIRRCLHRDGVL